MRLGRYHLLSELALGGMSEVFLARREDQDDKTDPVVVKRVLPRLAEDPAFVQLFEEEVRISSLMRHPNVVRVLDSGNVDGQPFIALEYVDGLDCWRMFHRCAARGITSTPEQAIFIASQVLRGLAHVHQASDETGQLLKIVHGDVSPTNVYISTGGDVKLGDFGIARSRHRDQSSGRPAMRGKVAYMSPEQVKGEDIDFRADLFSAGTVLAELLIKSRLFGGGSQLTTLLAIRDVRLDVLDKNLDKLPEGLEPVLRRALAATPSERFPSAMSMCRRLERFLPPKKQGELKQELAQLVAQAKEVKSSIPPVDERRLSRLPGSTAVRPAAQRNQELDSFGDLAGFDELSVVDGIGSAKNLEAVETKGESETDPPERRNEEETSPPQDTEPPAPVEQQERSEEQKRREAMAALSRIRPPAALPSSRAGMPASIDAPQKPPVVHEETTCKAPTALFRQIADDEQLVQEEIDIDVDESFLDEDPTEGPLSPPKLNFLFRRADGTALGPTSYEDAVGLIMDNQIRSTHEVSVNGGPFRLVKDFPELCEHAPSLTPATADVSTVGPPDQRGLLHDEPAWKVLFDLAVAEETGVTIFDHSSTRKEVYLVEGQLHYVTSNLSSELLGKSLVARGAISEDDLARALAELEKYRGRLGDALVGLNILEPVPLFHYISEQVQDKFMDIFRWRKGEYQFYRGVQDPDAAFPLHLPTLSLLWDGITRAAERRNFLNWLRKRSDWFATPNRELWNHLDTLQFPPPLAEAWRQEEGTRTLAEAAETAPRDVGALEFALAARLLADTGMLQLTPPEESE